MLAVLIAVILAALIRLICTACGHPITWRFAFLLLIVIAVVVLSCV